MTKRPKQRGSGQTGNTGSGHIGNRFTSASRGGNSSRGGAGFGKKPQSGCAVLIIAGGAAAMANSLELYNLINWM